MKRLCSLSLVSFQPFSFSTTLINFVRSSQLVMASSQSNWLTHGLSSGPITSIIYITKPYIFQKSIRQYMKSIETKDDLIRLQAVAYIDGIRKALQMYGKS